MFMILICLVSSFGVPFLSSVPILGKSFLNMMFMIK